ncbi:hypothetical protein, partial [Roseivivax sediminis]|uniref:hypothetical protein n=1 Tax=Roseivivax sediminis TaxID=936889 RepID=UPI001CB73019
MSPITFDSHTNERSNNYADLIDAVAKVLIRVATKQVLLAQHLSSEKQRPYCVSSKLALSCAATVSVIAPLVRELSLRLPTALPLARTVYEGLLSATYTFVDPVASKRAQDYLLFRITKDQVKHYKLGRTSGLIRQSYQIDRKSSFLKNALKEFEGSGKKSSEFETSRNDRIEVISEKSYESGGVRIACWCAFILPETANIAPPSLLEDPHAQ